MGISISKPVVYELIIAVKKGLQAKTDLMSHTMSVCLKREGFVKGNRMFGNVKKYTRTFTRTRENVLLLLLVFSF